jgi:hypothetical protein
LAGITVVARRLSGLALLLVCAGPAAAQSGLTPDAAPAGPRPDPVPAASGVVVARPAPRTAPRIVATPRPAPAPARTIAPRPAIPAAPVRSPSPASPAVAAPARPKVTGVVHRKPHARPAARRHGTQRHPTRRTRPRPTVAALAPPSYAAPKPIVPLRRLVPAVARDGVDRTALTAAAAALAVLALSSASLLVLTRRLRREVGEP